MPNVRGKYFPPSIEQLAFNCPHCGALAKQFWHSIHADELKKDEVPFHVSVAKLKDLDLSHIEDKADREKMTAWAVKMAAGRPFLEVHHAYRDFDLSNAAISRCFNCNDVALWIGDKLFWPQRGEAPLANSDLPDDVRRDYDEASSILDLSPRGAAALLRRAIQKICVVLGERGKNIDDDIASLAKKGLDPRVQQALDVVRVVGNNAVHPGQIDLRDDRATAAQLFDLVNLIAEIMISQPKHISEMYAGLPESSRNAIDKRDGKAGGGT